MISKNSSRDIQLIRGLQQALEKNLLLVNYKPVLNTVAADIPHFIIGAGIKTNSGRRLHHSTLVKLAASVDLGFKLDRWLLSQAQQDLKKLHRTQPQAKLFVPQSSAALAAEDYPSWIARQQELHEVTTTGLVLCFRLTEVSRNIKQSAKLFIALDAIGVEICLNRFPEQTAAIQLLKPLKVKYIDITPRLLKADDETIEQLLSDAHSNNTKVMLSGIDEPDYISLSWSQGADLLSGKYLHPAADHLAFEFPAVIA